MNQDAERHRRLAVLLAHRAHLHRSAAARIERRADAGRRRSSAPHTTRWATSRAPSSPSTRAPAACSRWSRARASTRTCSPPTTPTAVNAYYDAARRRPRRTRCSTASIGGDLNPPGSTFKLVVASAALASGEYTPESTLPEPRRRTSCRSRAASSATPSGGTCGPGDTVTIADALRLSCNIPFAELAVELGDTAIREEAEKYGFNTLVRAAARLDAVELPARARRRADRAHRLRPGPGHGDARCRWRWCRPASRTEAW